MSDIQWYIRRGTLFCCDEFDVVIVSNYLRVRHGNANPPIYPDLMLTSRKAIVEGDNYG